ncbi:MAG: hypothetical protein Kow0096_08730 [Thiohalomonadaceae bacterium]
MKNTIDAHLDFSFQGEHYALSTTLNLDALPLDEDTLPDFHRLLAQANGIDTYSYLYEVMESCDLEFSNATGVAARCLHDGVFDVACFQAHRRAALESTILAPIARRHLNVTNLDSEPALKQALLEAYHAGRTAGH